jgi:Dolichyl-phosphate-mannose-protein mannosyltransferase
MLVILPFVNYLAWLWLCSGRHYDKRALVIVSAAWWTLSLIVLTETLSMQNGLTLSWLATGWVVATIVTLVAGRSLPVPAITKSFLRQKVALVALQLKPADWWMISASGFICLCIGLAALLSPPNGSDQLQYHLPRVVQWAERHSVGFFPTHYYAQLFAPPLAEWMMLHSYILSGGDRFVGLVQWLSFSGSAVCASLIARELGSGPRGQIVAAVFCVTLPQGILEASGAKNDWVLSFWLAAMVWFLLRARTDHSFLNSCNVGISMGAAILSKGTAYCFLPWIVLVCLIPLVRLDWRMVLKASPVVFALVLLLNAPQWTRNYSLGGSFLGLTAPDVAGHDKYTIDRISVSGTIANVLREATTHLGSPSDALNRRATKTVRALIAGMNVDPDDPGATNYSHFFIPHSSREEYDAGNPLHLVIAAIVFFVIFIGWRHSGLMVVLLGLGILGSFVFYCAIFRWEIWCPRLHLPLFVVAAGVIATASCQRHPKLVLPLTSVLLITAVLPALCNDSRPLLFSGKLRHPDGRSIFLRSRSELYFTEQRWLAATYIPAANAIRMELCTDIGIDASIKPNSHDYALVALARVPERQSQFRYVGVHNLSTKFVKASDLRLPCMVICPGCRDHGEKWAEYSTILPRAQVFGDLVIFNTKSCGPSGPEPRPYMGSPVVHHRAAYWHSLWRRAWILTSPRSCVLF